MPTMASLGLSTRGFGQFGLSKGPDPVIPTVGSYHHIETLKVASGTQATFDFLSIPATYKHLEVRAYLRSTRATDPSDYVGIRLNNDTTSSYYRHSIHSRTHNTAAGVLMDSSTYGYIAEGATAAGAPSNSFGALTISILDYTSTTTRKSMLAHSGNNNGASSGSVVMSSLLWPSASVVNRVTIICNAQFTAGSMVSLYGIDGTL